jgi:hypothetical protein
LSQSWQRHSVPLAGNGLCQRHRTGHGLHLRQLRADGEQRLALPLGAAPRMFAAAAFIAALVGPVCARADAQICQNVGTAVVVDTEGHWLVLCENGQTVKTFQVSLGEGGLGKRRAGDGRTPLGTYALGQPRPSKLYYLSLPVGYPTSAQASEGYTGKGIMVHGPLRRYRQRNGPQTKLDWTRGCIALGTDAAIAAVAKTVGRGDEDLRAANTCGNRDHVEELDRLVDENRVILFASQSGNTAADVTG